MTRVSTVATVPPILRVSHGQSAPDCCQECGGLERLGDAILHPLRLGSFEPVDVPPAARKLERKRGRLPVISRVSKPGGSLKKSKFMNSVRSLSTSKDIAVCRQAAPVAKFADGCCIYLQGLASHGSCFQCTWTFGFLWHAFGHLTSSRSRARPRRCKTRTRPADSFSSSLLLTKLLAPSASRPQAECVEGALWRGLTLVVLYREEVGPFSRLQPTWYTKSLRLFCHGTEGFRGKRSRSIATPSDVASALCSQLPGSPLSHA